MAISADLGVSAQCMPETNINWGHQHAHMHLQMQTKKMWQHSSYSVPYTEEAFHGPFQPWWHRHDSH
jgi:hypothetical protein